MLFSHEIIYQPANSYEFATGTVHRHVVCYTTSYTCMPSVGAQYKYNSKLVSIPQMRKTIIHPSSAWCNVYMLVMDFVGRVIPVIFRA
jgi:hypothetical protein